MLGSYFGSVLSARRNGGLTGKNGMQLSNGTKAVLLVIKETVEEGTAVKRVLYELLVPFQRISAGLHPPVYRVFQGGDPAADFRMMGGEGKMESRIFSLSFDL